mgnify:CR=1 FL=1
MTLKPTLLAAALMLACSPLFAAELSESERAAARQELDAARGELRELTKRIADLSMKLGDHGPRAFAFEFAGEPRRALIGVVLSPDEQGAKIAAVTPGGPAAKAGLKAGDVILDINGSAVGKQRAAVDRVRDSIGALEAGTEVKVRYQRDGKTAEAKLVAERREPGDWVGMLDLPDLAPLAKLEGLPERIERNVEVILDGKRGAAPHALHLRERGPMREHLRIIAGGGLDLNLTSLNPELGKYFGASSGVLVLENEGGKLPQLKAGDVIQVIDGQPVDGVPGAMRLLTAKAPGQVLNVEVLRDRKKTVLAVEAPERDELFFRVPPPAPPAPPAAPAPPAPPAPPKAALREGMHFEWTDAAPEAEIRVHPRIALIDA